MIHTELDLPPNVYRDVELMAKANKRPAAQVLRELIFVGVERWRLRQATPERRGLGQLASLGIKGPKDFATNLDSYLYGDKE
jgi:hypothetical protein